MSNSSLPIVAFSPQRRPQAPSPAQPRAPTVLVEGTTGARDLAVGDAEVQWWRHLNLAPHEALPPLPSLSLVVLAAVAVRMWRRG